MNLNCHYQHRVHRVAMATLQRTFHHSPFHSTVSTIPSRAKVRCTVQLSGQMHSPYFYSTPIFTLWLSKRLCNVHCVQYIID